MVQMRWNRVQTSSEIEIVRVINFLLLKKNTDIYCERDEACLNINRQSYFII